ncbi:hypothetical protein KQI65_16810 [bacterium]|nr:hypothetical protein [bacterium]
MRSAAAPYESDILSARPVRYVLGLGPGAMYYTHDGSFSPSCDCNFSDQSDTQFHFAGEFLVQYPKLGFAYGVLVTYYDVSAEFSREEVRPSIVVGDDPPIDVEYRNTSNVTLQWLSVTPEFLWYIPRSSAFLMAGLELGFPLDARYDHIEHILTPGITYYDGNTDNVLVEESDIPDGTRMRFAIALGLGYEIHLGPSVSITPHAGLNLPLTTVSSTDDSWRVTTAYGLLMLQLRL